MTLCRTNNSGHIFSQDGISAFIEACESAYWRGHFERERKPPSKRHEPCGKPGEFFNSLPEETKERIRGMKSSDFNNIRWDAISYMCHPYQ